MRDLREHHAPIADAFFSKVCARLQRADSDIASTVLKLLRAQGILALNVHDSFLVQARHVTALEAAMEQAAAMHGYPGLPFKRSTLAA